MTCCTRINQTICVIVYMFYNCCTIMIYIIIKATMLRKWQQISPSLLCDNILSCYSLPTHRLTRHTHATHTLQEKAKFFPYILKYTFVNTRTCACLHAYYKIIPISEMNRNPDDLMVHNVHMTCTQRCVPEFVIITSGML